MKTTSPQKFKIYLIVLNLVSVAALANPDPGFPGSGDPGAPATPIDSWIIPMAIVGILMVFYYYKKQQNTLVK